MATQIEEQQPEDFEEVVEPDDEPGNEEQQEENEPEPEADEVDEVTWGADPVASEVEPEGMRNLRNRLREVEKEKKELERKVAPKVDTVGEKPQHDDYFDKPDEYDADLLAWKDRKRQAEGAETRQQESARKQQDRWEAQARDLDTGYQELRAPGKDTARATVEDQFPGEQFAYLVKAAGKNAPAFVLALGHATDKRAELKILADEGSWAEFIATAAIMAREVNVQRRKPGTAPEQNRSASGTSGGGSGSAAKTLERLEREADRSGDRSKIVAFKRAQKEGAAK